MNSKILILLIAGFVGNAFADSAKLAGVYYDYNKGSESGAGIGNGTTNIDGNLCWAAAASNGIQWWQTRVQSGGFTNIDQNIFNGLKNDNGLSIVNYPTNLGNAEGYTISSGNITYSSGYADSIWGTFVANWTDGGGFSDNAYRWWYDGSNASTGDARLLPNSTAGGYIKNVSWQSTDVIGSSSVVSNNTLTFNIKEWNDMSKLKGLKGLYSTINQAVKEGIVMSIGIYQNGTNGHAMTAYGCRMDENGNFFLTVADSDDGILGTKEVQLDYANNAFYFKGSEYQGYTFDYMTGFAAVVKKTFTSSASIGARSLNADLHTTTVDGVFYFGRDPNAQPEEGEYSSSVLWSDGNMVFEGGSSIWIDINMDYMYDTIECAGAFAKSESWLDGDKLYISIADFSDLGNYYNELVGLSIVLATFDSTDFVVSDFTLSSDINGYLGIGEIDGVNSLYLTLIPEPASYAVLFSALTLALALRRRRRK